jgi:hypothetical protein
MTRGVAVAVISFAVLAGYAEAQDKPTEETAAKGLQLMYDLLKTAEKKEAQCLWAIGNMEFCRCIATKLLSIDFVQYVQLMAKSDEEIDNLSTEDKNKLEVARKCRDLCTSERQNIVRGRCANSKC